MKKARKKKIAFDKYWHYHHSVQSPDQDVRFIQDCYIRHSDRKPVVFCEDFSFTFALSCAWVQMDTKYESIAIDIDKNPLDYGQKTYLSRLKPHQQKRVQVIHANVLKKNLPSADIIAALNFSYFTFKLRKQMKAYFRHCLNRLKIKGILILDCFGGSQCWEANEEIEEGKQFTYYWDQVNFDPVTHHSLFHIHYKRKGEVKRLKVFTYDWRLWTIPELRELLQEAGFRKTHVYWEGSRRDGTGNGKFTPVEKGEECDSWIAYIVAEK